MNIRAEGPPGTPPPPPPIVFAVLTGAYHEMLSAKILNDLQARRTVVEANADTVAQQVKDLETQKKLSQGYL